MFKVKELRYHLKKIVNRVLVSCMANMHRI